jgi:hypothetical protein
LTVALRSNDEVAMLKSVFKGGMNSQLTPGMRLYAHYSKGLSTDYGMIVVSCHENSGEMAFFNEYVIHSNYESFADNFASYPGFGTVGKFLERPILEGIPTMKEKTLALIVTKLREFQFVEEIVSLIF